MAALTSELRRDLQADLGIGDDQDIFTNSELDRLYTRAAADYDLTVVYALDQIMVDAAKLNDYRAGSSSESKSQVFEHLQAMRTLWADRAGVCGGRLTAGVVDLDFMEKGD